MVKELQFIINITKKAGKIISENFTTMQKGDSCDLVSNCDFEVEQFLISEIKKEYPNFDIVSEEFNHNKNITENCFVIDPIDGTVNFINDIPLWGIQIACVKNGKTVASAINLVKQNELFYADDSGAYLNGKRIKVSQYSNLKYALYSIDGYNQLPAYVRMEEYSLNRRTFGAACVSLAYVACGRIHGMSFTINNPWDYMPGLYLVKKAGGEIIDKPNIHIGANNREFANILEQTVANN